MITRFYVVTSNSGARIVEATSAAQAIRHCAGTMFKAKPATPKDMASLMNNGVKLEQAIGERGEEMSHPS